MKSTTLIQNLIDAEIVYFRKTVKDTGLPFAIEPRYGQNDALRVCALLREIGEKGGRLGLRKAREGLKKALANLQARRKAA